MKTRTSGCRSSRPPERRRNDQPSPYGWGGRSLCKNSLGRLSPPAMGYRVAVVGATGNVGREMLQILAERNFPVDDVVALASSRSTGRQVSFGEDKVLKVHDLAKFDFKGIDIVLSSPGAKVSAEHSPRAAKAGGIVIDNTSYWRMDPDVPLVVPEVNGEAIKGY